MTKYILAIALGIMAHSKGQVGIQTTAPTETLDVNGTLRVRDIPTVQSAEYIIVTNADGVHKKILLSSLQSNSGTCPNFLRNQSDGYHIKFSSPASVPNPTNSLTIQNKNFVSAGAYIQNNTYFYSWSNTTGQAININNMTVNFSGLVCTYTN